jgi:hypothetical protein
VNSFQANQVSSSPTITLKNKTSSNWAYPTIPTFNNSRIIAGLDFRESSDNVTEKFAGKRAADAVA